jgi:hypothetical protein
MSRISADVYDFSTNGSFIASWDGNTLVADTVADNRYELGEVS